VYIVVSTSAVDCLAGSVSKMIRYVLNVMLSSIPSRTHLHSAIKQFCVYMYICVNISSAVSCFR